MKIIKLIKQPKSIILYLASKGFFNWMSDKNYLKMFYRIKMGQRLNLENPNSFNEKLQWLKLHDRNDTYVTMVDKYKVKKYVANIIGQEHIIPTLGVYDNFNDIDFNKLPNQFVMKCTHDSGGLVICKNKKKFDIEYARKRINKSLKNNYYKYGREWPYKNVKRRIIIEKYMANKNSTSLLDYKFYCFNGKADYVLVCADRDAGQTKFYYYDRDWNLQKNFSNHAKQADKNFKIQKPKNLNKMFEMVEKLSANRKFVRVDLYNIDGKIYFGEYTFFPSSGFDNKRTEEITTYLNNKMLEN